MLPPTIFDSWFTYLATCAVMLCAQTVYVLFGFGAGLIAVGTLALVYPDLRDVVVMILLVNLPAELSVVLSSRRTIAWRGVLLICLGILVGIPLGTLILKEGEPTFVLALLGGFLIVAGLTFLTLPGDRVVNWPDWVKPPVGLVSGILTGLFGTGGPPLIVYYRLGALPKTAFRGNLMAIFLLMTFVRAPSYAMGGLITTTRVWSSLAVLPAVLLGAWLGHRIHITLPEPTFRRLVSLALMAIGLVLLLRLLGGCFPMFDEDDLFRRTGGGDLPQRGKTYGGTLWDLNRDTLPDLLLSRHANRAEIYLNQGGLRFARRAHPSGLPSNQPDHHGSAACDFDGDGDWDAYVTVGAEHGRELSRNQLWVQESSAGPAGPVFLDAAAAHSLLQDPIGRGRGALWADFDQDRRPELLLLNYASPARLLAREDDHWYDVTWRLPPPPPVVLWTPGRPPPPAVERARSTWIHTAVTADFDASGTVDLLAVGRAGYCGLWLNAGQGQFYDLTSQSNLKQALFPHLPSHAAAGDVDGDGDLDLVFLYRPDPVVKPLRGPLELWLCRELRDGPRYEPVSAGFGRASAHDPLAGMLADLDNDGNLDLYVVQSARGEDPPNLLLQGDGRGGFRDMTAAWGGAGPAGGQPESVWTADLDADGDLDLLTFNGGGEVEASSQAVVCYENRSDRLRGVTVHLTAAGGPGHGLGARLMLEVAGRRQLRQIVSLANPVNTAILPAHFGVGEHPGPFRLIIDWPDGRRERLMLPRPGVAYAVRQGEGRATVLTPGRAGEEPAMGRSTHDRKGSP